MEWPRKLKQEYGRDQIEMKIKKRIINKIGCFVAWWILHYYDDGLIVDRKAGARQIIKVFAEPAYRNVVRPAIHKTAGVISVGDIVTDDGYYGDTVVTYVGQDTFRGRCLADGRLMAGLMIKDFKKKSRVFCAPVIMVLSLVFRTTVRAAPVQVPEDVRQLSVELGEQYNICPELIQAVCFKESGFDPLAENGGCIGMMQVDAMWRRDRMERLGVTDLYDTRQNMMTGVDLLHELSEEHEDISVVLMTYNGDSRAKGVESGAEDISEYADSILTLSEELERENGK